MEGGTLVVKGLAGLSCSFFSSAQSSKVFNSLGYIVAEESHDNTSTVLASFNFLSRLKKWT